MGGRLYIDDAYHSGIEGCPGTRFVVELNVPPLSLDDEMMELAYEASKKEKFHYHQDSFASIGNTFDGSHRPRPRRDDRSLKKQDASPFNSPVLVDLEEQWDSFLPRRPSLCNKSFVTTISHDGSIKTVPMGSSVTSVADVDGSLSSSDLDEIPRRQESIRVTDCAFQDPSEQQQHHQQQTLPENLSVLFVDDDMVLRKLFSRTLKKVNPTWTIHEASNGETAIDMITKQLEDEGKDKVQEENASKTGMFDLIFMDQYMASVQKQLLGTETVRMIRAQGVTGPIICGLSANDVEDAFLEAGSDTFMFKPFPCKPDALKEELLRIVNIRNHATSK
jgi:CheY-like chemotaxis protein